MKILTKRCVFDPGIRDWVLVPVVIEVNSKAEFKTAFAAYVAKVERYAARKTGGGHDQA